MELPHSSVRARPAGTFVETAHSSFRSDDSTRPWAFHLNQYSRSKFRPDIGSHQLPSNVSHKPNDDAEYCFLSPSYGRFRLDLIPAFHSPQ